MSSISFCWISSDLNASLTSLQHITDFAVWVHLRMDAHFASATHHCESHRRDSKTVPPCIYTCAGHAVGDADIDPTGHVPALLAVVQVLDIVAARAACWIYIGIADCMSSACAETGRYSSRTASTRAFQSCGALAGRVSIHICTHTARSPICRSEIKDAFEVVPVLLAVVQVLDVVAARAAKDVEVLGSAELKPRLQLVTRTSAHLGRKKRCRRLSACTCAWMAVGHVPHTAGKPSLRPSKRVPAEMCTGHAVGGADVDPNKQVQHFLANTS